MPLWVDVLDTVGLLLAVALLYGIGLIVRRRILARHGGTFELSHRMRRGADGGAEPSADPGADPSADASADPSGTGGRTADTGAWVLGVGRYAGDDLEWFRIFSLAPRPKRTWRRSLLTYDGVRPPDGPERDVLYPDHLVVTCGSPEGEVDLAMSRDSLTGFQAWLESRTPGADWSR